jgi:CheY-like chemotaxis protein
MRVLVVDDSAMSRELTVAMLKHFGVISRQASSGSDALRVAAEERPTFVLIDYEMPGMDGANTARLLRSEGLVEDGALIVVLTAHLVTDGIGEPSSEGFDHVMSKPLRLARLSALLDEAEARSRDRASDGALLDQEVLDDLVAIRDAAGRSLIERRGAALLDGLREAVERVERATTRDDLRKAVHHLVGAAAALGARALADEARVLERTMAAGVPADPSRLRDVHARSERALRRSTGFGR